jgi:hypothetical protein
MSCKTGESMDYKEQLTNEKISKRFISQFELVNYAIKLAENMIDTGRDPRVKVDTQNRSLQILCEILSNKDRMDEIVSVAVTEIEEPVRHEEHRSSEKVSEKKKNRRILAD